MAILNAHQFMVRQPEQQAKRIKLVSFGASMGSGRCAATTPARYRAGTERSALSAHLRQTHCTASVFAKSFDPTGHAALDGAPGFAQSYAPAERTVHHLYCNDSGDTSLSIHPPTAFLRGFGIPIYNQQLPFGGKGYDDEAGGS